MARYVIADIHGGAKTFQALLDKINLCLKDCLYLLGDYVDRGPDSKGVLDIILKLAEAGYDVRPIRGNHDDMMLRCATGNHDTFSECWMESWGRETLKSFGVEHPVDLPFCYVTIIESMPYIRFDDHFVFVHAGLDMNKPYPIIESSSITMTWGDNGDIKIERLGGRRLVTGHKINPLVLIKKSQSKNHILLDNGAFTNEHPHFGNLVALNLDTQEFIVQPWCDGNSLI